MLPDDRAEAAGKRATGDDDAAACSWTGQRECRVRVRGGGGMSAVLLSLNDYEVRCAGIEFGQPQQTDSAVK